MKPFISSWLPRLALSGSLLLITGCDQWFSPESKAQSQQPPGQNAGPATVDVAVAETGILRAIPEYTGTTQPLREVSVRSQVEGQLLRLNVDVGDRVGQGQTLAELDDALLVTDVNQARAEQAARQSEVASAQSQVSDSRTRVEQARLEYQQAQANITRLQQQLQAQIETARLEYQQLQSDAKRLAQLQRQGVIPVQQAEQAQTAALQAQQALANQQAGATQQLAEAQTLAQTAAQVLQSSQEQVSTQQQAVQAAQGRVASQAALVDQARERQSYAVLTSPVTGAVLQRLSETGNLVQPGTEILRLGDFSQVKVVVSVSELDLVNVQLGQSVQVRLDALPDQSFTGRVSRISPAADATTRLIPVEVTMPGSERIGSGLLARVQFTPTREQSVIIPQSALEAASPRRGNSSRNANSGNARSANPADRRSQSGQTPASQQQTERSQSRRANSQPTTGTVFVVTPQSDPQTATVTARQVVLGEQGDGNVAVRSGLRPGERYVVRSGKPIQSGDTVRLSILSKS